MIEHGRLEESIFPSWSDLASWVSTWANCNAWKIHGYEASDLFQECGLKYVMMREKYDNNGWDRERFTAAFKVGCRNMLLDKQEKYLRELRPVQYPKVKGGNFCIDAVDPTDYHFQAELALIIDEAPKSVREYLQGVLLGIYRVRNGCRETRSSMVERLKAPPKKEVHAWIQEAILQS